MTSAQALRTTAMSHSNTLNAASDMACLLPLRANLVLAPDLSLAFPQEKDKK
jgi:hypothetical protein